MRTLFVSVLALCLALTATGYAQSSGSYAGDFQGSMNIITTSVCSPTDTSCLAGNAKGLLAASIKVSTGRSLAITGSLETALQPTPRLAATAVTNPVPPHRAASLSLPC